MQSRPFLRPMERRYHEGITDTKLRRIREGCGLSQSGLAKASVVASRSLRLYEQKVNDIDKAQAQTLYKLARTFGCSIEDLLENPESP